MTLQELEKEVPKLLDYTKTMPEELRRLSHVKIHPPGSLIHQKDYALNYLGIVAKGENRVINEFENGKIYMIETNKAIDFIGEVTLLANMPKPSRKIPLSTFPEKNLSIGLIRIFISCAGWLSARHLSFTAPPITMA